MNNDQNLQIVSEVLQGVSIVDSDLGILYFKHLLQEEQREILSKSSIFLKEAKSKGLMTEKEAMDELYSQGMWGHEEEDEIKRYKNEIELNSNSMKAQILPSKIKNLQKAIERLNKKLFKINSDKESLMGLTCEKFVNNQIQKTTIEKIVFFDKAFKDPIFDSLYINEKNKEMEIYSLQKDFFQKFDDKNISAAVLSDYFSMYLPFSEDVLGLFGKPLVNLTTYQLKMISYGRYFLNIFKNSSKEIPENVAKDPELLVNFYQNQKTERTQTKSQHGEGGSAYFGANEEDLESLKSDNERAVNLSEEVKKRGGSLNMQEMMKLHGV